MWIDINIDSLQIVFYLVLQYKKIQMLYFIQQTDWTTLKKVLINGKLFQGIGVIYTLEIEGWKNILKRLHWTKAVLAYLKYPIAARHFAFGFETTDLHNLLNFEYSLLDEDDNLIEFKTGEDKIPAINFTIQILN